MSQDGIFAPPVLGDPDRYTSNKRRPRGLGTTGASEDGQRPFGSCQIPIDRLPPPPGKPVDATQPRPPRNP